MMGYEPRGWAEYWADLANLDDLGDDASVDEWARRLARLRAITTDPDPAAPRGTKPLGAKHGVDSRQMPPLAELLVAHPEFVEQQRKLMRLRVDVARRHIRRLLAGDPEATRPSAVPIVSQQLRITDDGRVEEVRRTSETAHWDLHWLYEATKPGRVFPIRKCSRCSKAFPRHARQIYCGKACRRGAGDDKRSGTSKRQASLRKSQATFRAIHARKRGE